MTMKKREGFTNGLRRVATEQECITKWSGDRPGVRFRCALCAHRFKVGDGWRWQYSGGSHFDVDGKRWGVCNFMVCDACDGPDVIDRWVDRHREYYSDKFWALRSEP